MAKLTPEQISSVALWAEEGATLNDIQRKLKDEFGIVITYLDARLLMMDVGVRLKDKPKEPEPAQDPQLKTPAPLQDVPDALVDEADDLPDTDSADAIPDGQSNVSVTVDTLALPGAIVSGKATFSDGKTISWYVDQMGRLGMRAPEAGYKPPQGDVADFQNQLDRVLMEQGF